MTKGILGYGRYDDDPEAIGCPRARTDMTPCVARDGKLAQVDAGMCVGCNRYPANLLRDLVRAATAILVDLRALRTDKNGLDRTASVIADAS